MRADLARTEDAMRLDSVIKQWSKEFIESGHFRYKKKVVTPTGHYGAEPDGGIWYDDNQQIVVMFEAKSSMSGRGNASERAFKNACCMGPLHVRDTYEDGDLHYVFFLSGVTDFGSPLDMMRTGFENMMINTDRHGNKYADINGVKCYYYFYDLSCDKFVAYETLWKWLVQGRRPIESVL